MDKHKFLRSLHEELFISYSEMAFERGYVSKYPVRDVVKELDNAVLTEGIEALKQLLRTQ
jgi:hypothetical protein